MTPSSKAGENKYKKWLLRRESDPHWDSQTFQVFHAEQLTGNTPIPCQRLQDYVDKKQDRPDESARLSQTVCKSSAVQMRLDSDVEQVRIHPDFALLVNMTSTRLSRPSKSSFQGYPESPEDATKTDKSPETQQIVTTSSKKAPKVRTLTD